MTDMERDLETEKRLEENAKKRKRKRRNPKRTRALVIAVIIVVALFASARNVITLRMEHSKLEKENEELRTERDEKKQELENVNSRKYIEQQAREQLKLINPDEILFVFEDEEGTYSQQAQAAGEKGEADE
jgi:cell division protein DivIC